VYDYDGVYEEIKQQRGVATKKLDQSSKVLSVFVSLLLPHIIYFIALIDQL